MVLGRGSSSECECFFLYRVSVCLPPIVGHVCVCHRTVPVPSLDLINNFARLRSGPITVGGSSVADRWTPGATEPTQLAVERMHVYQVGARVQGDGNESERDRDRRGDNVRRRHARSGQDASGRAQGQG